MPELVNDENILYPGAYHLFMCLVRSRFGDVDEIEDKIPGITERIRRLNRVSSKAKDVRSKRVWN